MKSRTLLSPGLNRIYLWVVAFLALTGAAQMPIFKRYYIADIPGFGWLAMYYTTHALHYAAAAVFLFMVTYSGTLYRRDPHRPALTGLGAIRLVMLWGTVITGIVRTIKNLPGVSLPWPVVMTTDIAHLGFAFGLGIMLLISAAGHMSYWRSR